jgi:RNA polymerase-binding transcription factor DksA
MAKNKKSPAKAVKKAAKAKPAAKAKKAAPAKAKKIVVKKPVAKKPVPKKEAPKKAVVAKKAAPPKPVHKEVEKPVAKKVAVKEAPKKIERVKEVEKAAPVSAPAAPVTSKPSPPQLNIFPVPNQRPIAHKQVKAPSSKDERTRYSDDELKEFEALILRKLDKAREEYKILKDTLNRNNDEGTDATSGGNTKVLEDGAETAEKENLSQLAARQQKYITNLENALVRIKNGTYGICSVTGKLIPKERLIAVPHTTQSIEAKMMQQD